MTLFLRHVSVGVRVIPWLFPQLHIYAKNQVYEIFYFQCVTMIAGTKEIVPGLIIFMLVTSNAGKPANHPIFKRMLSYTRESARVVGERGVQKQGLSEKRSGLFLRRFLSSIGIGDCGTFGCQGGGGGGYGHDDWAYGGGNTDYGHAKANTYFNLHKDDPDYYYYSGDYYYYSGDESDE